MNNKLYTILIPTHNRGELLKENLETLLPQVRKYQGEVSVFVSDNASKDDTEHIVKSFLAENADILEYHRHETNIFYAPNFIYAVTHAQAKYVCLMGDDDIMLPNHVDTVMSLLRQHPDAGIVNFNVITVDYDLRNGFLHNHDLHGLHPIVYPTGKEFIFDHLALPSHMSTNVFDREGFLSCLRAYGEDEYPGYQWFFTMYKSILSKPAIYVGYPLGIRRLPMPKSWEIHEPWYQIRGLGNVFHDLEQEIPHLYEHWMEHVRNDRKEELHHMLISATIDKALNRQRFEKMRPFMVSADYAQQFLAAIQ